MRSFKFAICFQPITSIVSLQVLPTIVPFSFGEEQINLDNSVMASCSVMKGDLPLNVWWRFTPSDDSSSYNLTTNDGVVIMRTSQKISILAIDAVKARHMGNYTCFAQNNGGATHYSTYLAIHGSIINIFRLSHVAKIFAICFRSLTPSICLSSSARNRSVQFRRRRIESRRLGHGFVLDHQRRFAD